MAEEEKIRENAKPALQALTKKKNEWNKKLTGILWEIFIIIVMLNITALWFQGWSAKRHEQELAKNFLIETKNDLGVDANNLHSNVTDLQHTLDYYDSLWVQVDERRRDTAFIDAHSGNLLNTSYFTCDNSRFESFKSLGYVRLIENANLLKEIAQLYTVRLPEREAADKSIFDDRQRDFTTYIGAKVKIDSSGKMYVSKLLDEPEVKYQIYKWRNNLQEMERQKQELIQAIDTVATHIDQELKTQFKYKGE